MDEEFALVETAEGKLEAEILRGLLESNGIDVLFRGESAAASVGLGVGPMAEVAIYVPKSKEFEARELLAAYRSGSLEENSPDDAA